MIQLFITLDLPKENKCLIEWVTSELNTHLQKQKLVKERLLLLEQDSYNMLFKVIVNMIELHNPEKMKTMNTETLK
ncbi:MAG: hypothetical protein DRP42_00795 [Tenericutes bacterium]|nr:MAG: hypothetical protein DRP42_00795 [Mycoplasmatota bacterium]